MKPSTIVKFWGSQAKAAKALGVTQQCISYWVKKGEDSRQWVPYIKFLMGKSGERAAWDRHYWASV